MNRFVRYALNRFSFSKFQSFAVLLAQLLMHDQDAALSLAAKAHYRVESALADTPSHTAVLNQC